MPPRLSLFATAARGTEELLAGELEVLGARHVRQDRGGVRFNANLSEALHICLWTRIAMRVLYPIGQTKAAGADGLYEAARNVEWEEHLDAQTTFAIDATLKDSEHTHSGFVAQKLKDGLVDRLRERSGRRPDVDTKNPDVRIVAHLNKDELSLSLDLCGEPLFRRGYRDRSTVAPLKETLAAAILRAAKFVGEEPLFDPMCGSGTLLLEGAQIATRRAPGLHRTFSVERWPSLGESARALLAPLRADARAQEREAPFPLVGLDKDEEAIAAAKQNTKLAKLRTRIVLRESDALMPWPPETPSHGLLVTNPPYGERLSPGGQKGMKSFYFKLGDNMRRLEGFRAFILSGNPAFESAFHSRPRSKRALWNGPIECELLEYSFRPGGAKQVS